VHELLDAFLDVDYINKLRNKLDKLRQTKSVASYITAFRDVVVQLGTDKPDDDVLLHKFQTGLQRDVQL
jgi:hypothetical protein